MEQGFDQRATWKGAFQFLGRCGQIEISLIVVRLRVRGGGRAVWLTSPVLRACVARSQRLPLIVFTFVLVAFGLALSDSPLIA